MRTPAPVGRYETVLLNGERIALLGSSRLGIFAGLSMGPFAKVSFRKAEGRRQDSAGNAKYFARCYRPHKTNMLLYFFNSVSSPVILNLIQIIYTRGSM